MSENLATILTETAERHGDRIAFKLDDVELNYAALNEGSARVAGLLKEKGIGTGDRVGLMLPNVPYFPAIYYGILRAGAIVVPMNVLLKAREVEYYLSDSGARLLFAWGDFGEDAEGGASAAGAECVLVKPGEFEQLLIAAEPDPAVAERSADDTAVILYTSGTTGKPKGAELTHSNLKRNCGTMRVFAEHRREHGAARRAAAVPQLRADLHDELRGRRRGEGDDAAALRPGEGTRDHRARRRHDLPGRADDVQRDAARARRRFGATRRRSRSACRAARRSRSS